MSSQRRQPNLSAIRFDDHLAGRVQLHEVVYFGLWDSACRQLQFFETHQVHQRGYRIDKRAGDEKLFQLHKSRQRFEGVDGGLFDAQLLEAYQISQRIEAGDLRAAATEVFEIFEPGQRFE